MTPVLRPPRRSAIAAEASFVTSYSVVTSSSARRLDGPQHAREERGADASSAVLAAHADESQPRTCRLHPDPNEAEVLVGRRVHGHEVRPRIELRVVERLVAELLRRAFPAGRPGHVLPELVVEEPEPVLVDVGGRAELDAFGQVSVAERVERPLDRDRDHGFPPRLGEAGGDERGALGRVLLADVGERRHAVARRELGGRPRGVGRPLPFGSDQQTPVRTQQVGYLCRHETVSNERSAAGVPWDNVSLLRFEFAMPHGKAGPRLAAAERRDASVSR